MNDIEDKLLKAIATNNTTNVENLLKAGANANDIGYFDETPLIYACRHQDIKPEIITLLLKHGANPNHQECEGFSPLLISLTRQNIEIAQILLDNGAETLQTLHGKNIIWYSLQSSNQKMLPFILERTKININQKDQETDYTSLDWACFHKITPYIERLKQCGAKN